MSVTQATCAERAKASSVNWVYDLPTWQFALILAAIMLCLACGGHVLMRRVVTRDLLARHNDVAGFVASLVGVIYAVMLSFVVIVVWQEYDASTQVAQKEASAVADIYHLSYGLPARDADALRHQLARYINDMIDKEWPAMQEGSVSLATERDGHAVLRTIMTFKPDGAAQDQIRSAALGDVQTLFDARRERRSENETSLPRILWFTLIFGAIVTVGFTYFFGMESARLQITMTAGLTLVVAMMFVLIIELDFPFRGDTRVRSDMWTDIRTEMGAGLPENPYRS
jgi:hypothetical protein